MEVMNWEWEYERVSCVVGVVRADWGCGRWLIEVYKCFSVRVHWGRYQCTVFRWERLDNICLGAWE